MVILITRCAGFCYLAHRILRQSLYDGAIRACTIIALLNKFRQYRFHGAQIGNFIFDSGNMRDCDGFNVATGRLTVIRQPQQGANFFESKPKLAGSADEYQPLDMGGAIHAVPALGAGGLGHNPNFFVKSDCLNIAASPFGEDAD